MTKEHKELFSILLSFFCSGVYIKAPVRQGVFRVYISYIQLRFSFRWKSPTVSTVWRKKGWISEAAQGKFDTYPVGDSHRKMLSRKKYVSIQWAKKKKNFHKKMRKSSKKKFKNKLNVMITEFFLPEKKWNQLKWFI